MPKHEGRYLVWYEMNSFLTTRSPLHHNLHHVVSLISTLSGLPNSARRTHPKIMTHNSFSSGGSNSSETSPLVSASFKIARRTPTKSAVRAHARCPGVHIPCSWVFIDQYQCSMGDDTTLFRGTSAIVLIFANGPFSAAITGSGVSGPTICTVDRATIDRTVVTTSGESDCGTTSILRFSRLFLSNACGPMFLSPADRTSTRRLRQ